MKSMLSIIADSGVVEVCVLDKNAMSYLPDWILRQVYEKISERKEPDRPFDIFKIEERK